MKQINTNDITKKSELLGHVLLIEATTQTDTEHGTAILYDANDETTKKKVVFFGSSVMDRQEIQKGDRIKLSTKKGKRGDFYYALPA
jgi:hypothetical protein